MSLLSCIVQASEIGWNTQITNVYAQSISEGSSAHLVKVSSQINSKCNDNRLYIDLRDKDLLAAVLTNYASGKKISVMYRTDAPAKTALGHLRTQCKLISIW